MQCHHCQADTLIKADHFGAERLFCTSCRQTSRAETFEAETTELQQKFLQYIYNVRQTPLSSQWEGPWALSQNAIAKGVGMARSNINRVSEPLIKQGLVTKKLLYPLDENGQTVGRKRILIYSLTPAGSDMVRNGFSAETFGAESSGCSECGKDSDSMGDYEDDFRDCDLCGVLLCGDCNRRCEGCSNTVCDSCRCNEICCDGSYCDECHEQERSAETFESETFRASKSDLRRRRRTPFYKIKGPDAEEDHDVNRYAQTNAGGALWEATYQALRDEGRSHAQSEAFCNSKFFDHYYEALIEGLRRPMRKVLKDIRKANREKGRDFDKKYFIDESVFDNQVFEAPSWADTAPTPMPADRPSAPWPSPTDMIKRPRRPYRRPRRRGPLPLRPRRRDV